MSDILICPKCQERLWVGEMQIPLVTCPRCLGSVINPNAGREAVTSDSQQTPLQVMPLEEEAGTDIRDTTRWLVVLSLSLIIGAFVVASVIGMNLLSAGLLVAGVAMAGANLAIHRKSMKAEAPVPPYPQRVQRGSTTVFDYASNIPQERNPGMFVLGFFLAIGLSFLTMMGILAARGAGRGFAIAAAAAAVGGLTFFGVRASQNAQRAGFFSGVLTGLLCGAMGCGPCAMMGLF